MLSFAGLLCRNLAPNPQLAFALRNALDPSATCITHRVTSPDRILMHCPSPPISCSVPYIQSLEGLTLDWDGRVDNASDLAALRSTQAYQEIEPSLEHLVGRLDTLRDRHKLTGPVHSRLSTYLNHTALILAAYRYWGDDFLRRISGDFSIVIADRDRILLARDPFGVRRLFYHSNGDRLLWSSNLSVLLAFEDVPLDLDEEYIAGHLARNPAFLHSPFAHIRPVPPGCLVELAHSSTRIRRFWNLDPERVLHYQSDREYEEQFRHLFKQAVQCRLPDSDNSYWAELSGGVDSSSIVCVGDAILRQRNSPLEKLQTISQVYDEARLSDERRYIQLVEQQRGVPSVYLQEDNHRILYDCLRENGFVPTLGYQSCFVGLLRREYELIAMSGGSSVLSGFGGDQLLWSEVATQASPELADHALRWDIASVHRDVRRWSSCTKASYWKIIRRNILEPCLSVRAQVRLGLGFALPDWIDPDFARRTNFRQYLWGVPDIFGYHLPSKKLESSRVMSAMALVSTANNTEMGDVDLTYPFLHVPLVEFLMSTPIAQKLRPGETRSLHRRALAHYLPREIAARQTKGGPEEAMHRALARDGNHIERLFHDARSYDLGIVDRTRWESALRTARHGAFHAVPPICVTVALEAWLRGLDAYVRTHRMRTMVTSRPHATSQTLLRERAGTL